MDLSVTQSLVSMIIGFALGAAATSLMARVIVRGAIRRAREAERRARGAERMAEIGALTGGLAHEIKNPLSTIGLNAQLLDEALEDAELDSHERERLRRRLGTLGREVERLKGILTDFLEFAGELRFDPSDVEVNALVEELGDFFLPQAESAGVRLRVARGEGPIVARIDEHHTKQAVLNLMLNAVQAMEHAADLDTGTTGELLLRVERGPDGAVITVTDTGPGIDPEKLSRVFEPYFTTKAGGSGLGLPTTRRLIEGQDGTIDVTSEPGKGTSFTVRMPLAPA
ncbi:MAG: ATP-binding protein [Planctomycetota bacterium]